jgi:hypothetical protein
MLGKKKSKYRKEIDYYNEKNKTDIKEWSDIEDTRESQRLQKLYEEQKTVEKSLEEYYKAMDVIYDTIENNIDLPEKRLYRGVRSTKDWKDTTGETSLFDFILSSKKGDVISFKGQTSFSSNEWTANSFTRNYSDSIMFEIEGRSVGIPIMSVSKFEAENEFLVRFGQKFEIRRIEYYKLAFDQPKKLKVILRPISKAGKEAKYTFKI